MFAIGGGKAGTVNEAAAFGDSVLMGIPLKNYKSIPVRPLAGKIVVDANNYYPARDGNITELDSETGTSSELLAAHLPDSTTIKASNAITMADLEKDGLPPGSPEWRALPLAGEDAIAEKIVADVYDQFGFDSVDVGPLSKGLRYIACGSMSRGCGRLWPLPADRRFLHLRTWNALVRDRTRCMWLLVRGLDKDENPPLRKCR